MEERMKSCTAFWPVFFFYSSAISLYGVIIVAVECDHELK